MVLPMESKYSIEVVAISNVVHKFLLDRYGDEFSIHDYSWFTGNRYFYHCLERGIYGMVVCWLDFNDYSVTINNRTIYDTIQYSDPNMLGLIAEICDKYVINCCFGRDHA